MEKTKKLNMELPKEGRFISSEFPILRENLVKIDQAIDDIDEKADSKASSQHLHAMEDVVGLETALKNKMAADKTFSFADLSDVEGARDAANNYVLYKLNDDHFTFGSAISLLGEHQHKAEDIIGLKDSYQELHDEIEREIKEIFPSGFIATFAMKTVPSGWLLCDGATYKRTDYPRLFKAIGDQWGKDSDTTFKVPDFRGVFLRGFDNGRGLDQEREFAKYQPDSIRSHTHNCTIDAAGGHAHKFWYSEVDTGASDIGQRNPRYKRQTGSRMTESAGVHTHRATISSTGGAETRPVNATVIYAIKA
ncbi:putative phage tail fiber protein [Bartonella australis AUST/NH1]|uniref:Putative phage tail fiber protein n=1 Tax=Bartonella australis (strain Aust/NH1) TaxID=1094489 RepID=M1N4J8_BARAA|nr:Bgr_08870 family protein [Bartonella australis]AGF74824.1 putative phage tail fiber protein [Bartonella australis AUST/NH1]